eukprot:CAMPEP_0180327720 /NCGR_PEP_ID=MMETSP0988-20121125/39730_1 /TAXON_ID=697907 /ORGANISM="non described non described, Strain CCMP2293" /LENGTH=45 /DNA_ID= /DNA_START= /DNA_END= /DNA_ORIENTATION=
MSQRVSQGPALARDEGRAEGGGGGAFRVSGLQERKRVHPHRGRFT